MERRRDLEYIRNGEMGNKRGNELFRIARVT